MALDFLLELGLDPSAYNESGGNAWRGPCVACGGERRMVIFVNNALPSWYLKCDNCGLGGWIDQLFPNVGVDWSKYSGEKLMPSDVDQEEYDKYAAQKLLEMTQTQPWEAWADSMEAEDVQWWENAGIPADWQKYWRLGVKTGALFYKGVTYSKKFYTIPKFAEQRVIKNVDYRIVDPPLGAGKYRSEPHLPPACFLSNPDEPFTDEVFVVEGSKKAMVLSLLIGKTVIGVPAKKSWAGIEDKLREVNTVYVILDPDAGMAGIQLTRLIGTNARNLLLPTKIDDGIIKGWVDLALFNSLLKQARQDW
jgi:hypothetical protein